MRIILPALFSIGAALALPLTQAGSSNLDRRVREFLDRNRSNWHDLNVPEVDGRTLHDLVLKHRYTKALEIGTSTGHSGIWIAWALSKTGGRLITIDIDERRHKIALANFKEAGLSTTSTRGSPMRTSSFRNSRARSTSSSPTRTRSGTRTTSWPCGRRSGAAVVLPRTTCRERGRAGIREFLAHLKTVPNAETTIDRGSSAGLSITFKRSS